MNDVGSHLFQEFLLGAMLRQALFSWLRRHSGAGHGQA
jgi:hypothetical protein